MIDLNKRAKEVHNLNHKWWHDLNTGERLDRNKAEMLMLVISEVAEAMEGERKDLMDDHLPHRKMAEVELADAYIRTLDYAYGHGLKIDSNVQLPSDYEIIIPHLTDDKGECLFFMSKAICNIPEDEDMLSVFLILIYAYSAKHGYDLEGAFQEKLIYNTTRKDHQKEARLAAGGKKW